MSLAHHGLLFLDEFPEFPRNVLELPRQPLEEGSVALARAQMTLCFSASFMLVAAVNPCPCGYHGDSTRECRCTGAIIQRYLAEISGPLLDRIDLHIEVPAVAFKEMRASEGGASSAEIRVRVEQARTVQRGRGYYNAHIPVRLLSRPNTFVWDRRHTLCCGNSEYAEILAWPTSLPLDFSSPARWARLRCC